MVAAAFWGVNRYVRHGPVSRTGGYLLVPAAPDTGSLSSFWRDGDRRDYQRGTAIWYRAQC